MLREQRLWPSPPPFAPLPPLPPLPSSAPPPPARAPSPSPLDSPPRPQEFPMKAGSGFGGTWLPEVAAQARHAEELGYDFASTPETAHDSMLAATLAAANTEKLEIQTS